MQTVRLKIVEEGRVRIKHDLIEKLSNALLQEDIVVTTFSPLELKVKFTMDHGREFILLILRDSYTRHKLKELIIPCRELTWIKDIEAAIPRLLSLDSKRYASRFRLSPVRLQSVQSRLAI
jgi:hypothetical protein